MPEPLLLIPGLMCTAALFGPQIEAFSGGREVLVANHTRASNMPGIARQILDDAPDRFALAGLSRPSLQWKWPGRSGTRNW